MITTALYVVVLSICGPALSATQKCQSFALPGVHDLDACHAEGKRLVSIGQGHVYVCRRATEGV